MNIIVFINYILRVYMDTGLSVMLFDFFLRKSLQEPYQGCNSYMEHITIHHVNLNTQTEIRHQKKISTGCSACHNTCQVLDDSNS